MNSYDLCDAILKDVSLTSTEKLVGMAVALRINRKTLKTRLSMKILAEQCAISPRSAIAANGGTGGGGGGGAGKVTVGYVNLIAGQTVNVTIGAGGLPGSVDMTAATGSGAGGMATGTSRAYGGGSGASGASSGGSGWANTQPEVNQFFGGTGGSGGSNGTGYGGGGGGKGGNGNYSQATGGTGGDNGKNGGAGVTANATIISGGAGGSGAVIIEY